MAIYHLSVKTVSRSSGRSAPAAAAYRTGSRLTNERDGLTHDYTRRGGVVDSFIVVPPGASWAKDRAALWNAAEAAEKRVNSVTAREYEVALPAELSAEQRSDLARAFAAELVKQYGVAADVAIHAPGRQGDQKNHHAHILTTTRTVGPEGLGVKTRALDDQRSGEVDRLRETWANLTNQALERACLGERVTHLSLRDQGLDRASMVHLGQAATALERRGIESDRGDANRAVKAKNQVLETIKIAETVLDGIEIEEAQVGAEKAAGGKFQGKALFERFKTEKNAAFTAKGEAFESLKAHHQYRRSEIDAWAAKERQRFEGGGWGAGFVEGFTGVSVRQRVWRVNAERRTFLAENREEWAKGRQKIYETYKIPTWRGFLEREAQRAEALAKANQAPAQESRDKPRSLKQIDAEIKRLTPASAWERSPKWREAEASFKKCSEKLKSEETQQLWDQRELDEIRKEGWAYQKNHEISGWFHRKGVWKDPKLADMQERFWTIEDRMKQREEGRDLPGGRREKGIKELRAEKAQLEKDIENHKGVAEAKERLDLAPVAKRLKELAQERKEAIAEEVKERLAERSKEHDLDNDMDHGR